MAEGEAGGRVHDLPRSEPRRHARRPAAEYARRRLVRRDQLHQFALPGRAPGRCRRWPAKWATKSSPSSATRSPSRSRSRILELFNGEYFIQKEDPQHADAIGVGPGCYIDQVFGQTWAHWVGLGRLFDREKQLSALRALWKYNFVPDVGPFREQFPRGRWYAKAGDAGLIMCSWPKEPVDPDKKKHWQYMYFNECMTGFEWQAAAHMV